MTRRYFFAYHLFAGIPYPFTWVEEDGSAFGGRPTIIDGTKREITEGQWNTPLNDLAKEFPYYPFKGDGTVTTVPA